MVRVKVENKTKDSLERQGKEKKKKKREYSPSVDKHQRSEKDVKKAKLHHYNHQHDLSRPKHPDLQPQRETHSQPRTFTKEQVPVHHRHHHNNHHLHQHDIKREGTVVWTKMTQTKLQKPPAPTVLPSATFTFTPLKVAKAKSLTSNKEKHNESELKLKLKNENTDANVKIEMCKKKKKGIFQYFIRPLFLAIISRSKWMECASVTSSLY